MSSLDVIASILVVVTLVELVLWLIQPEWLLSISDLLYDRPRFTQAIYLLLGMVVLWFLLQHLTLVEIMASFALAALVMGMGLAPFGHELTEVVRRELDRGTFWKEFGLVWLIWGILVVWTGYELLG